MEDQHTQLRTTVPLETSADTLLWSPERQQKLADKHKRVLLQWLDWHLGSFEQYSTGAPLRITLTRLAPFAMDDATVEVILTPVRDGIERWCLRGLPAAKQGECTWQYAQRTEPRATVAVEISIEEHPLDV